MRFLFFLTSLLLVGCLSDQPGSSDKSAAAGSDTSAAALLTHADKGVIDQAMHALRNYNYLRQRSITVRDESNRVLLHYAHTTRFTGPFGNRNTEVLDTTATGRRDAGFWKEYASGPFVEDTLEWSGRLLPEDPLVLNRKGTAYYHYSEATDTTIGGIRVVRIDVELLSKANRTGIQSGRFYVEPDIDLLVGFDLRFLHKSLLFDEDSHFRYLLQRSRDGTWLPDEVDVNTFLNLPLTKGQRFFLHARYSNPSVSARE